MLKKLNLSAVLTAALICSATAKDVPLEWNCRYDNSIPRETVIDRSKLDKLAGISKDAALEVYAVSSKGENRLETKVFDSNVKDVEMLRFTVPAGTEKLIARSTDKKVAKSCSILSRMRVLKYRYKLRGRYTF